MNLTDNETLLRTVLAAAHDEIHHPGANRARGVDIVAQIDAAIAQTARKPDAQPYFAEGTPAMLQLESMVDKVGLRNVLYALEHICANKAAHVRENWQDNALAKRWNACANKFGLWARTQLFREMP